MDALIQFLIDWGYWGMFISAFLAGTILPFSSEAVLLACIGLGLDPIASTLSTTAGNALGGLTCYGIGHLGKMEWIEKYLKVDKNNLTVPHALFKEEVPGWRFSLSTSNRRCYSYRTRINASQLLDCCNFHDHR